MADFYFYGRRVATIFQALPTLGTFEDDMSRGIGSVLSRCPQLLKSFVTKVVGGDFDPEVATVKFQVIDRKTGRTDLEIESRESTHLVVEAKRGSELPTKAQLTQYATRLSSSQAAKKAIVVLTDCSPAYAKAHICATSIMGTNIIPMSWGQFMQLAADNGKRSTVQQRYLITELLAYLKRMVTMQQIDSNWVYVLALAEGTPPGWGISWIDFVTEKRRYFHPVGTNGWPADPPNYIAFRYAGELQSIHHIEGHQVIADLNDVFPEIPKGALTETHYLYKLGKPFRPEHRVPTGKNINRGARRWCMLDTLFTSESISEAESISKQRESVAPEFAPR
jgi:hypothetical protein